VRTQVEPAVVNVLLGSDLPLIAEAVAAALRSRGFRTTVLEWPGGSHAPLRQQAAGASAEVAVLLYDVDVSLKLAAAGALLRGWSGPWLVLTGADPGPAWGGLTASGASAVRSRDLTLAETDSLLRTLAAGRADPAGPRIQHVAAWHELQARHGYLQQRLDSLAPRQLEVLTLLHQGLQVAQIAPRLGLAETTVRSNVHSILRRMGVRSQLAAVAKLHAVEWSAQEAQPAAQSTGERQST
jgi:DNA-binding NarL/FixJ family response regulator